MKKLIAIVMAIITALFIVLSVERVSAGNVGVVYSASGVEEEVLTQRWHFIGPFKAIKQFPISQQQIVFSNDPADYNEKKHDDWSIDAPANGGMVKLNITVNYRFLAEHVVDLYKKFNGMDGEDLVEQRIQNSMIAYIKEVTPKFTVMDIYSDKKAEVNAAITEHLNVKLKEEYGMEITDALIIDVELDAALQEKIKAKEQAKQDAEIAELDRKTAIAQAETDKVKAETQAAVELIQAEADAQKTIIAAQAEAEANQTIAASITENLISMKEAEARLEHGWVTVQGAGTVVTQ